MATATALARARPAKTRRNPTPTSQVIGPEGPKHPGNRQLCEKRGRPDAAARLCGNLANPKVATFCAALWPTFTLPLTVLRDFNAKARSEEAIELGRNRYISAVYFHALFLFSITKSRNYEISRGTEKADPVEVTEYISDLFNASYAQFLLNFETGDLVEALG